MKTPRCILSSVCLSLISAVTWLVLVPSAVAGEPNSEFPRTTSDVIPVGNIEVSSDSEDLRLELPPNVAPVSATPLFIPAGQTGAHLFATMILPETILDPSQPPVGRTVAWWDVLVKVTLATTAPPNEDVMISIDKDVLNQTPYHWTDFHMELGQGFGATFEQSNEFDFLFFKTAPPENQAPISSDGKFMNPPTPDEPVAPDVLWWDWNPPVNPGVKPDDLARFWLGINVPREMFTNGMATFTLRQHATIPEPATGLLVLIGLLGFAAGWQGRRSGGGR